jgi:hypothetical protein
VGDSHFESTEAHEVTLVVERMDGRRIDRVLLNARPRAVHDGESDGADGP